jgi:Zn-finger nucleic acid-binding protein
MFAPPFAGVPTMRYASQVHEKIVCLGCGLIVDGPGDWGCSCPPPSMAPHSASRPSSSHGGPYRALPEACACPRCSGRLGEATFSDARVLDCGDCGGLFLPRSVIDALLRDDRSALRLAFPQRDRVPEPPVRYLNCPLCDKTMNRENFGSMSGVVVDVCLDDGVWFDAGEVNSVIAFVSEGGLERAKQRKVQQSAEQKARLGEQLRAERTASAEASHFQSRTFLRSPSGAVVRALSRWFLSP